MELWSVAQSQVAILDHAHKELVALQTFLRNNIDQLFNNGKHLGAAAVTQSLNVQLSGTAICLNQSLTQSLLGVVHRIITSNVALVAIESQLDQIRINSHGINLL